MKVFALAGNPNSGKTTLFNNLTGSTAHVGNWPGVTVDKKDGVYKKLAEPVSIQDLPGIYSLSPYTPEEVISRKYILDEKPDCIINIVDATNLERNLYLTTQLMEIDIPLVIALNMVDVVEKSGDSINAKKLEEKIGVPVVAISALKETNIDELMKVAYQASSKKREGTTILKEGPLAHLINDVKIAFKGSNTPNPLFHAIKLVELDELETKDHLDLVKMVDEFKATFNDDIFGDDFEALVADARYKHIAKNYSSAYTKNKEKPTLTKSDKIDKVLTNRWLGIPIFLVILFLVFHLTFSENFLFLGKILENHGASPSFAGTMFEGLFWTESGINSPGVILFNLLDCLTGAFSSLAASWLANASSWVSGLIVDGILAGLFSVLSFLPQILCLFLFFSVLEDSGYMARVAFILDRIFRRFGLSGRSFMPMIMGFGCSIPAMVNTRTLADENERTATIRVIPFFSCGAKLPILTAIAGGIVMRFGVGNADIITYSMYLLGIITAIVTVLLMRNTTMRGDTPPFIMELPAYHAIKFKSLVIHLWDKVKHFIKKAFTIILASTILIWFLQSFTAQLKYIDQADPNDIADNVFLEFTEDDTLESAAYREVLKNIDDLEAFDEEGELQIVFTDLLDYYDELEEDEQPIFKELVLDPILIMSYNAYQEEISSDDYLDQNDSVLAHLGLALTPIFTPMGFGSQLSESGWIFPVSAATGLIAKENVVASFQVLAQAGSTKKLASALTMLDQADAYLELYNIARDEEGVNATVATINATGINKAALIAFIAFNMLTIPCFAAVATAKAELGNPKRFRNTIYFWLVTSFVTSTAVYLIGTWWWTSFIFAALVASLICGIILYNKKHPKVA